MGGGRINLILEYFGKNSLIIMGTHYSIVMPFVKGENPYVNFSVVLIIEILICVIVNKLIKKK